MTPGVTSGIWEELSQPWQACVRLAWEAYCAGSLPIASVVTDRAGRVLSRGRNRLYEEAAPPHLAGHPLAHAEMNALVTFDFERYNARESVLYTTTEPCPLCMGAIRIASIREFHFASRDPWAGCSGMLEQVPYFKMKNLTCVGPQSTPFENALVALQIETHLRQSSFAAFFDAWRAVVPVGVAAGESLHETGELQALARAGAEVERVLELIEGVIDQSKAEA